MRIISGNFKGKKILKPKDLITRPLKDLTKESIFNIINHSNKFSIDLQKSTVLDLFSGIGSFGLECISRGCDNVSFVENYLPAASILKKNIGTTSTMEGTFSFLVTKNELNDILEISSIGFETIKINVQDFINRRDKKIILKEKLTALDEVVVKAPINYINQAIKSLKINTISKSHQLNILLGRLFYNYSGRGTEIIF